MYKLINSEGTLIQVLILVAPPLQCFLACISLTGPKRKDCLTTQIPAKSVSQLTFKIEMIDQACHLAIHLFRCCNEKAQISYNHEG